MSQYVKMTYVKLLRFCIILASVMIVLRVNEVIGQEAERKEATVDSKLSDNALSSERLLKTVLRQIQEDDKVKKGTDEKSEEEEDGDEEEDSDEDGDEDSEVSSKGKDKRRDSKVENKGPKIWDQWSKWSACSVTCGIGKITRWRHCVSGGCATGEKEAQIKTCTLPAC